MNKSIQKIGFLLALALLVWVVKFFENGGATNSASGEYLNRHPKNLIYTKHARCRMDCRHFTEKEVREILSNGKINVQKSRPNDTPCPTVAMEGTTSDGQSARMIFASCNANEVKVVTCIDLDKDYTCHCD